MANYSKIGSISSFIFGIALLVSVTEARDHLVGGQADAWKVPSSDSEFLNKWSSKTRFHIGDNLVWKYDSSKDAVLQVKREAYLSCNTTNPIKTHKKDMTMITLVTAGPHFYISGVKENCDKGEKIVVVVMSPRNRRSASPSPAPSPAELNVSPAVAPTSGVSGVKVGGGFGIVVGVFFGLVVLV